MFDASVIRARASAFAECHGEVKRSHPAFPQSLALSAPDLAMEHLSTAASKLLRNRSLFGNFPVMDGTRVSKAVARIETALSRLERAVAAIPDNPPADQGLARRNEELEATLRDGLTELDRIIGRFEK